MKQPKTMPAEFPEGAVQRIPVILFDMDGLMFDTERLCIRAWDYAGEKMGLGKAGDMVYKTLGMNRADSLAVWEREFGSRFNERALAAYSEEFYTRYYAENPVPVKDGLRELLPELRRWGFRLGVVSSTEREKVRRLLRSAGVETFFETVTAGDMVEHSKPQPDIYRLACSSMGIQPSGCLALEDSRNGLLAASRAGCLPVMIPDLWQPDPETERLLFARRDSLADIPALLREKGIQP